MIIHLHLIRQRVTPQWMVVQYTTSLCGSPRCEKVELASAPRSAGLASLLIEDVAPVAEPQYQEAMGV